MCKYCVERSHPELKASVKVSADLQKIVSRCHCWFPRQSVFSQIFFKCVVVLCSSGISFKDFKSKQNPKHFHFAQLARCDTCGHEGKLSQSLQIPGDVKHFCDLKCLLHLCHRKLSPSDASTCRAVETPGQIRSTGFPTVPRAHRSSSVGPQRAVARHLRRHVAR